MTEAINRDLIFQFVFNGNWKEIGRKKLRKLERNWKIIGGSWFTVCRTETERCGNGCSDMQYTLELTSCWMLVVHHIVHRCEIEI